MGRKSSAKSQNHAVNKDAGSSAGSGSGPSPLIIGAVIVAIVAVGVLAFWRSSGDSTSAAASSEATGANAQSADPRAEARAAALANLGPHKQASLPPIPFQVGYAPPRSPDVVTAAYQFAAEHPEILSYVPCFCGCERAGHQGNHDCFVKARAENGDVVEWDEHGVDCAVCLDVATRSRQMYSAGASAKDIRAAVDREFGSQVPGGGTMHTPHPSH
jgi:Protein of unknown function with PCYCGC motif